MKIKKMDQYLSQTNKDTVKLWINSNLANYLKSNNEDVSEIEHILDYLNSDKAPKRISRMSYKEAKSNSTKWLNTLIKQGNHINETEADIKVVKSFRNGFKLVKLIGKAAFEREGYLMSHCVGSYHDKSDCEVYSLRDPMNMPHCTMELQSDSETIQQIKGKGNGSIHPDYIKMVIDSLTKFKIDVRSSEMRNLGYVEISSDYMDLMISFYKLDKTSFFKFKNNLYFNVYTNLVKK